MKTASISFLSETFLKLRRNNSLFVETYVSEKWRGWTDIQQ